MQLLQISNPRNKMSLPPLHSLRVSSIKGINMLAVCQPIDPAGYCVSPLDECDV